MTSIPDSVGHFERRALGRRLRAIEQRALALLELNVGAPMSDETQFEQSIESQHELHMELWRLRRLWRAPLTSGAIRHIRSLARRTDPGRSTQDQIAEWFGVNQSIVSLIKLGNIHADVED